MATRPVTGIVLSAGASSRMGRPKALLELAGQPLLCHHISALSVVCARVKVVLGASREEIAAVLPQGVDVVCNPAWAETGPAESLLAGLEGCLGRCLVTPVDTPPAPLAVLAALLAGAGAAVPTYRGRDGHPVLIESAAATRALPSATLAEHLAGARRVALDWPDMLLNLNTPAQWAAWAGSTAGSTTRASDPR